MSFTNFKDVIMVLWFFLNPDRDLQYQTFKDFAQYRQRILDSIEHFEIGL